MKISCCRVDKAKVEVLLDENLTIEDLNEIFGKIKNEKEIPAFAIEVLINKSGKRWLWNEYLKAVNNILTKRNYDRSYLLALFNKKIREKLFGWLNHTDPKDKPGDFFGSTYFCIKVLINQDGSYREMLPEEEYAYRIGQISGRYIRFKKLVEEVNNSLNDILTYSKYDREKLRYVAQRVALGISLSKAEDPQIQAMRDFMKQHLPSQEIDDSLSYNDYSYFFYKGAFEQLGD